MQFSLPTHHPDPPYPPAAVTVWSADEFEKANPGQEFSQLPYLELDAGGGVPAILSMAAAAAAPCGASPLPTPAGAAGAAVVRAAGAAAAGSAGTSSSGPTSPTTPAPTAGSHSAAAGSVGTAAAGCGGGAGAAGELGTAGAGSSGKAAHVPLPPPEPWAAEWQRMGEELASLRAHREWADTRIGQLIRRVGEAERPVREEAAKLTGEVEALKVGCTGGKPCVCWQGRGQRLNFRARAAHARRKRYVMRLGQKLVTLTVPVGP